MASLKFTITLPTVPTIDDPSIVGHIRERFLSEAGTLILDAIRKDLGSSDIYQLSPEYAKRKPFLPGFRRAAGKPADQPIILTGALYDNLTVIPHGDSITIEVQEGMALSPGGYDYAELWEQVTGYLEAGLFDVEHELDELLLVIIEQELLL